MKVPPFSVMNREERHLCAILYHLLQDTDNLRAFQGVLDLEPRDDAEVFVEAAFVRDYFNWWREECSHLQKSKEEFDDFCHKAFGIRPGQPSESRVPKGPLKGFLSLQRLWKKSAAFDDPYCALLPSLANMRFDVLLLTPHTFALIETKLHTPIGADQIHLQQVLGKILNRLPGYERHAFCHFLVSDGRHSKLEQQVAGIPPPVPDFRLQQRSWTQVLDGLPCVSTRQREEIRYMLRLRR